MPGLPVEVVEGELSGLRGELRSVDFPRITMALGHMAGVGNVTHAAVAALM